MKVLSATFSHANDRSQTLSSGDGTDFQQLIRSLEKDMWPGADAGPNQVGSSSVQTSRHLTVTPQPHAAATHAHASVESVTDAVAHTGNDGYAASIISTMRQSIGLAPLPPENDSILLEQAAPVASIASPPRQSEAADVGPLQPDVASRTQPQLPTAADTECLHLPASNVMPNVVARFSNDWNDILQLRRAMHEALRWQGIGRVPLTINGPEYLSWIEQGTLHGN